MTFPVCSSVSMSFLLTDGAFFLTGSTSSSPFLASNSDTREVVGGIDAVSRTSASCLNPPPTPNPTELAATLAAPTLCPLFRVTLPPPFRSSCGIGLLAGETDLLAASVAAISEGEDCLPPLPSAPDLPAGGGSSVLLPPPPPPPPAYRSNTLCPTNPPPNAWPPSNPDPDPTAAVAAVAEPPSFTPPLPLPAAAPPVI